MKKFFLFLATLMLGFGQLFADEVTFSVSDLMATLPEGKKFPCLMHGSRHLIM